MNDGTRKIKKTQEEWRSGLGRLTPDISTHGASHWWTHCGDDVAIGGLSQIWPLKVIVWQWHYIRGLILGLASSGGHGDGADVFTQGTSQPGNGFWVVIWFAHDSSSNAT
jgi:hypothetical protein